MPKGKAIKRDFIKSTDTKKTEEIDQLSAVDKGYDYLKTGQTAGDTHAHRD